MTMVHPARSAGIKCHTAIIKGQFQGVIEPTTPTGLRRIDSIFLQLVNPQAPMDGEIDYVDRANPQPGDYYYVRVTQLDGTPCVVLSNLGRRRAGKISRRRERANCRTPQGIRSKIVYTGN